MAKNEAKVTIAADVSAFQAAMRNANAAMSGFRAEARLADAQLKNNGQDVSALRGKVQALTGQLEQNRAKQQAITDLLAKTSKAYGEDSEQAQKLRTQLTNVKAEEQKIIGQLDRATYELDKQAEGFEDAEEAAEDFADSAGGKLKEFAKAAAAAFGLREIKDFIAGCVDASAEIDAQFSAMEQVLGDYSAQGAEKLQAVADAAGSESGRMVGAFTSLSAKFKGLGYDTDQATDLAARGLALSADAAAFWDKSLDDAQGSLNSFINGSYEGGEAIGLFANDTQLAQYAIQQGLVKSKADWTALDEATKQATRLEYAEAMFAMSGATGQAAKESGQYANVQANLSQRFREFQAALGNPILQNIVVPAMQAASEKLQQMQQWVEQNRDKLDRLTGALGSAVANLDKVALAAAGFGAAMGALKFLAWVGQYGSLSAAVKSLTKSKAAARLATVKETAANIKAGAVTVANTAKTVAHTAAEKARTIATKAATVAQKAMNLAMNANPIAKVIAIVSLLIGAFVALWSKSESFRNFFINMWEAIKTKVSNVVGAFQAFFADPFGALRTAVDNIVKWVAEHFKFGEISLPHIKLPHFSITPAGWKLGDLTKGVVPHLGVQWYAKGAVLTKPTVFGVNGSSAMVGGEAGPEAVAPIGVLQGYIMDAVAAANSGGGIVIQNLTVNADDVLTAKQFERMVRRAAAF